MSAPSDADTVTRYTPWRVCGFNEICPVDESIEKNVEEPNEWPSDNEYTKTSPSASKARTGGPTSVWPSPTANSLTAAASGALSTSKNTGAAA